MQVCIVHIVPMLVDGRLMAVYTTRSAWNLTDLVGHTHTHSRIGTLNHALYDPSINNNKLVKPVCIWVFGRRRSACHVPKALGWIFYGHWESSLFATLVTPSCAQVVRCHIDTLLAHARARAFGA